MRRQAGVVLPLFSIRTRRDWGIGQITDLPACAEWLKGAGQRLVQVLPPLALSRGETSPYGALTAFALDPIYVDVDAVADLDAAAVDAALGDDGRRARDAARSADRVAYDAVRDLKSKVLRAAFDRFFEREWSRDTERARSLRGYMQRESAWLDDFALYNALREDHHGWSWTTWPEDERTRAGAALDKLRGESGRRLLEVAYVQWIADEQWQAARAAMRAQGVELMGDVPFVTGIESADVWAHANKFQMALSLGAPPDDFSADGQDWGLPPYDWAAMDADDLAWIRARARRTARLYDRMRLDHVVGYFRMWVKPKAPGSHGRFDPDGPDAQRDRGRRVLGAVIGELRAASGDDDGNRAIAEDLGVVPPFVRAALEGLGMPGYRVLPWERDDGRYRDPAKFPAASVACWSTHDTAPIDAWWDEFTPEERAVFVARAHIPPDASPEARSLALLGDLYATASNLALTLVQELLGVRDRINLPGSVGPHNWTWRLPRPVEDLAADDRLRARFEAIRERVARSGR